jgi:pimeloyl-ACP methyl ester carboxylesterase
MQCKSEAYKKPALQLQSLAAASGFKVWVGLPEFIFDAPEPLLIDHYISDTLSQLKSHGFTGNDIFMAAHSLGGVISQNYLKDHHDIFKGLILQGSALLRDKRLINN